MTAPDPRQTNRPQPSADAPGGRPRVPLLSAARRPVLARFLLRRYLRAVVVKAAGTDRPRPAMSPPCHVGAPAASIHRHTR